MLVGSICPFSSVLDSRHTKKISMFREYLPEGVSPNGF